MKASRTINEVDYNIDESLKSFANKIDKEARTVFNHMLIGLYDSLMFLEVDVNGNVKSYDTAKHAPSFIFSNLKKLAEQMYVSSKSAANSDKGTDDENTNNEDISIKGYKDAIQREMEFYNYADMLKIFVSDEIAKINNTNMLFIALKLNKSIYDSVYKIPTDRTCFRAPLSPCIIDNLAVSFFEEVTKTFSYCFQNNFRLTLNHESLVKNACYSFFSTITTNLMADELCYNIVDSLNNISDMEYEKKSLSNNGIILTYNNSFKKNPVINLKIKLKNCPKISEPRRIRKLLEMTSENVLLISDGNYVYGLGSVEGSYNPQQGDLYIIKFTGKYKWSLFHDNKLVLNFYHGNPSLPRNVISLDSFEKKYTRIFAKDDEKINYFYRILLSLIEEKSGTTIIISDFAEDEANRLQGQSTQIVPTKFTLDEIKCITKIDGAVLFDTNGICYSVGTILDGIAVESKGDPTRGARYNSAIRYYYMKKVENKPTLIIVISDDGMIDIIPNLKPRIDKCLISIIVNKTKELAEKQSIAISEYNDLILSIRDYRFYFSKRNCKIVNDCFERMKENVVKLSTDETRLRFVKLKPHEDFSAEEYLY